MANWLILGASPQAPASLAIARERFRIDTTITTNAGIMLEPTPDFYALLDPTACHLYHQQGRDAQSRGTRILSRAFNPHCAGVARKIDHADEFVNLGGYEAVTLSGLFCCEYAAKHGASMILMAGLDGYDAGPNYFAGAPKLGKDRDRGHTKHVIPHVMLSLCGKYPAIEFVSIGTPNWLLPHPMPNYRIEVL